MAGTAALRLGAGGLVIWFIDREPRFGDIFQRVKAAMAALGVEMFPDGYNSTAKLTVIIVVILVLSLVTATAGRVWVFYQKRRQPSLSQIYEQVSNKVQRYYQNQLRRKRNAIQIEQNNDAQYITNALRDIRESFADGYKKCDIRVTLMIPASIEGDNKRKLYIEFWSNDTQAIPRTYQNRFGFAKGQGYCGKAWELAGPIRGSKKKWVIFPDRTYIETSRAQRNVKCFLSFPVESERLTATEDNLLCVINVDAKTRNYFPRSEQEQIRLLSAVRPLVLIANFHLLRYMDAAVSNEPGGGSHVRT